MKLVLYSNLSTRMQSLIFFISNALDSKIEILFWVGGGRWAPVYLPHVWIINFYWNFYNEEIFFFRFMVWNFLFVLVRLGSITLSVLTFWYGLALQLSTNQIDVVSGNFNTQLIRINCLVAVCLLQAWMMWNFINFHLKRMRERAAQIASSKKKALAKKEKKMKKDECKYCFCSYHLYISNLRGKKKTIKYMEYQIFVIFLSQY